MVRTTLRVIRREGLQPARIAADYGAEYLVHSASEATRAVIGRRLRAESTVLPSVGDWVGVVPRAWDTPAVIHGVVERRTSFSRKVVHREAREQVLAANVDVAFVVASADDVNVRRIERYLAMAWQSGAVPAVVLTKSDLAESVEGIRLEIEEVAAGTPVLATSAVTGEGSRRSTHSSLDLVPASCWARQASASQRSSTAWPVQR